ncbi:MAG: hypothetical protein HY679_02945, partial [Chloroflexi bacterium]|nr:hypothetical protein [Chloroflexota bacterium]
MKSETGRTRGRLGTFAGRYSYEEIKVGSKTGESLMAFDEEALQFVVIKRPSPTEPNADARRASIADLAREEAVLRTPGLGDHPAVCRLLDAGEADGRDGGYRYLVLERARGTPVPPLAERYYRQGQPLPPRLYLDIMRQLLALLAVAHRLGVVYNDVKAEHLFWEEKTAQLKVIDWGNAQFAAATTGLTPADDVFQCGELLYEFITLSKYGRSGLKDWVAAGRLLWEPPGVDSQLKRLVAKALDPIPVQRYATAAEMADDLLAYCNACERRVRESRAAADGAVRVGDLAALRDSDVAMQALLAYDPSDTEAATLLSATRRRRSQLPEWEPATAADAGQPQASPPAPSSHAAVAAPPAGETFSTPAPTLRGEPSVAATEGLSPPPNLPARARRIRKRRAGRTTARRLWIGAAVVVSLALVVGLVAAGLFTRQPQASGSTAVVAVTPAASAVPLPATPPAVGSPSLVGEATQDSCSATTIAEQAGRWDEVLAQVALAAGQPPTGCGGRSWADIEAHARLRQECAAVRATRDPALINRLIAQYGAA